MSRKSLRFFFIFLSVLLVNLLFAATLDAGSRPRLAINAIGISKRVVEFPLTPDSWAIRPWEKNVGHLAGTGWFGQPGNIVLAGHSKMPNGAPGTFYYLNQLGVGSDIALFDGSVNRHYSVVDVRSVSEYDISVTLPTADDRLTLITCDIGSYDAASQSYAKRLVVIAQRVS
jgi:LPXTG-site transpeptidase (sortase) family protein